MILSDYYQGKLGIFFMLNESVLPSATTNGHVTFQSKTQKQLAVEDILLGLKQWRTWMLLAYQDIKLRYRRSKLGPFWITISMAITVYSMGFLYSQLFHTNLEQYFPFLVSGMITWALISMLVNEVNESFYMARGLIRQIKIPYSLHVHRVAARNMIIFFHNLLVLIPILFIFPNTAKTNSYTLLMIPGLLLIYINTLTYGLILGLLGARFRDVPPIIKSLMGVIFFITPVMWDPKTLSTKAQFLVLFNPFYSFVQIIRAPMLGQPGSLSSYLIVLFITVIGILVSFNMFTKYRTRIVYWL